MSTPQNPVQVITKRMTVPGQQITIDYPVVIGMQNLPIQQRINTAILTAVHQLMQKQINQLIGQGYQQLQLSGNGWYEIKTNERGILSLLLGNYTMAYPAAHGMTFLTSLNFDVHSGRNYPLSALFQPGSNYVKVLSDQIAVQIKERDIPLLDGFQEIRPDQDYYIADKALVIYFQLYALTPYYYGFPMFPISVYTLTGIIDENGPLAKMDDNA